MSGLEGPNSPLQWLSGPRGYEATHNSSKSLGGIRPNPYAFGGILDPKWDGLPASQNVEDRRGENPLMSHLQSFLEGGMTIDQFKQMLRNPLTPLSDISKPSSFEDRWGGSPSPQMQNDFGTMDAGTLPTPRPLQKQYRQQ